MKVESGSRPGNGQPRGAAGCRAGDAGRGWAAAGVRAVWLGALALAGAPLGADGGFFMTTANTLAQERQEVVIAIHEDDMGPLVTYVIASDFSGPPQEFAWILPVGGTVVEADGGAVRVHESRALFDDLRWASEPIFRRFAGGAGGGWFACAPLGAPDAAGGRLVEVVAEGEAGGLSWVVLDAEAGEPLIDWLRSEGYAVPDEALPAVEAYTQATQIDWSFVAVRVSDAPGAVDTDLRRIPPVEFTVRAPVPRYPMVISSVSAAPESEVLIYTIGERAQLPAEQGVFTVAESELMPADNPSGTNYEDLVRNRISALGPGTLVLEHAAPWTPAEARWSGAPWDDDRTLVLTRMRTLLAPQQMTFDYAFEEAPTLVEVRSDFIVGLSVAQSRVATATWLLVPVGFLLTRRALLRRNGRRPGSTGRSISGSP